MRAFAALIAGLVLGSAVNMALVTVGPMLIPPPEGVDVTDMDSLAASIHLFETRHFVFPFLAHALGTFSGALTACMITVHHKTTVAYVVGALSFAGGIAASRMIPAPATFVVVDLVLAYFPMAWLALQLGRRASSAAARAAARSHL